MIIACKEKQHIVSWEPEGHYRYRFCSLMAPIWFSMDQRWTAFTPFWISTDKKVLFGISTSQTRTIKISITLYYSAVQWQKEATLNWLFIHLGYYILWQKEVCRYICIKQWFYKSKHVNPKFDTWEVKCFMWEGIKLEGNTSMTNSHMRKTLKYYEIMNLMCRPYLALLVAVSQDLQAVGDDGQELDVITGQQGNHLLETTGQTDSHLGSFLVEEEVVEGGDGIEEHRLHWRATMIGESTSL